jgi:TPR repeat protein
MKKIALYTVIGMITFPVLILILGYTVGLFFRPEEMSLSETFKMINQSTFSLNINSRTFIGNLYIWIPVGGIIGMIVLFLRQSKRKKLFKRLLLLVGLIIVLAAGLVGYRYMTYTPMPETLDEYVAAANKTGRADYANYIGYLYAKGQRGAPQDYQKAKAWYEKAALKKDPNAMCSLGWLYNNGLGVTQDYDKARMWFKQAAQQGQAVAMRNLGILYRMGHGVKQDYHLARIWYKEAAAKGELGAIDNLAQLYQLGLGGEKDIEKSIELYIEAAARKDAPAAFQLGNLYLRGVDVKQDYPEALFWFEKAADYGSISAMINLGWLYQHGKGVKQDYGRARELYKKAADHGNASAINGLGWLYLKGFGVKQNSELAIKLFKRAAEKGNGKSMQNLGWVYSCGIGVEKDKAEAEKWYKQGTEAGNLDSFRALAGIYYYEKDYKKACEYYRKGALLGYSPCMNAFGTMNLWGRGTPVNYTKAREWYQKAAALNNPLAMNWLGKVYEKGYGVPSDTKQAEEWYQKAVALNCAPAMGSLALLWADNGQTAKAEKLILKTIKGYSHPHFIFENTYGYILFKQGKDQAAIKVLSEVVKQHPKSGCAKLYLGEAYFKLKQYKKAEKQWQAALKLEDNSQIFTEDVKAKIKQLKTIKDSRE